MTSISNDNDSDDGIYTATIVAARSPSPASGSTASAGTATGVATAAASEQKDVSNAGNVLDGILKSFSTRSSPLKSTSTTGGMSVTELFQAMDARRMGALSNKSTAGSSMPQALAAYAAIMADRAA